MKRTIDRPQAGLPDNSLLDVVDGGELADGGLRYYDVLRWGIAEKELNHTFTGVKLSDDPQARNYRGSGATASPVDENMYYQFEKRTWAPHNRYFPIPQNDLNVNKNLKQNEGYN